MTPSPLLSLLELSLRELNGCLSDLVRILCELFWDEKQEKEEGRRKKKKEEEEEEEEAKDDEEKKNKEENVIRESRTLA